MKKGDVVPRPKVFCSFYAPERNEWNVGIEWRASNGGWLVIETKCWSEQEAHIVRDEIKAMLKGKHV